MHFRLILLFLSLHFTLLFVNLNKKALLYFGYKNIMFIFAHEFS
jgi:hypothetical protein